jgi:hypothetical protein
MSEQIVPGTKVAFDVEGSKVSPYGYATVTRVGKGGQIMMNFDYPPAPGMRVTNIRPATEAAKK